MTKRILWHWTVIRFTTKMLRSFHNWIDHIIKWCDLICELSTNICWCVSGCSVKNLMKIFWCACVTLFFKKEKQLLKRRRVSQTQFFQIYTNFLNCFGNSFVLNFRRKSCITFLDGSDEKDKFTSDVVCFTEWKKNDDYGDDEMRITILLCLHAQSHSWSCLHSGENWRRA